MSVFINSQNIRMIERRRMRLERDVEGIVEKKFIEEDYDEN